MDHESDRDKYHIDQLTYLHHFFVFRRMTLHKIHSNYDSEIMYRKCGTFADNSTTLYVSYAQIYENI